MKLTIRLLLLRKKQRTDNTILNIVVSFGVKMADKNLLQLKKWLDESNNIVFFGGAGVSTESGIPDFRSVDGLYNTKYDYPPEEILSHTFFVKNTKEFYRFYTDKMIFKNAKPNYAHYFLAELEKLGKLKAVITQNIDNLHQMAGSKKVLELHGSVYRNYCRNCKKFFGIDKILACAPDVPKCDCGGIIKPDVVLYEEGLSNDILFESIKAIENAEVFIIGGTSLSVYPAASLVNYYHGDKLVLINKTPTPYDRYANLVFNQPIGRLFESLKEIK